MKHFVNRRGGLHNVSFCKFHLIPREMANTANGKREKYVQQQKKSNCCLRKSELATMS